MKQPDRILIADDDDPFRETLAAYLRKTGYECTCAADSAAAFKLLGESNFDLLISDLDMSGNKDLAFIREVPKVAAGLPVILLTAHPTVESAAQSVRLPVVAYLVKPANLDELQTLVRQSIERYRTYRTVSANRQRLQNWLRDLSQIEELLSGPQDQALSASVNDYMALTFQNLLLSLMDLKQMIQAVASGEGKEDAISQVSLIDALRQTIEVLAKTRQSFKSKELGELRRHLEELIRREA